LSVTRGPGQGSLSKRSSRSTSSIHTRCVFIYTHRGRIS
jgi:hypothetical protein